MQVWGRFVRTWNMAPALRRHRTINASSVLSLSVQDTYPVCVMWPLKYTISFTEIGTPWRQPTVFPVLWKWASSARAAESASSAMNSVAKFNCAPFVLATCELMGAGGKEYQLVTDRRALEKGDAYLLRRPFARRHLLY